MRWLVVIVVLALLAGCGGDDAPSAQDAEAHVQETYEAQGEGINVRSVYCEEGSGERFECEVSYSILGTGQRTDRTLVDFDEIP